MQSQVLLEGVSKGFLDGDRPHRVLENLSLEIKPGETVALTGPSGSGKSTLLNLIAGFEHPDQGRILLAGQDSNRWQDKQWSAFRRRHLGVVFQQFNLLTPFNVRDNILFPLSLLGEGWQAWCDHLVQALGLTPLLNREVESLSGGQQQRVAIARALAHKPELLLADEPTGNLDAAAGDEVMQLLCALAADAGSAILMVTHSETAAAYMQRRWHLQQGRIHE
ncbi:ABC transporter ATP-binding protein [Shewanella algae]|uniref:ABC transporter ATP-binding protein n=1 Tax=Shewanella algae TaxID=38313 RepID=UPI001F42A087|nr:ABC transporter ATP-binding protein [Shewanella algae]MCE9780050.1 ABC transporter ATP-binding protein [Shewanella algae]MCE9825685.1 ABC transporter ATP-binding protein [Shewanella algae]